MKFLFIDSTDDFPNGYSAGNTKFRLLAEGFESRGYKSLFINRLKGDTKTGNSHYTSISSFISVFTYNKKKYNIFFVYKILKKFKENDELYILTSYPKWSNLLIIKFISLLLNAKICYVFHEWHIAISNQSFLSKLRALLFDSFAGHFFDYIFPISFFLETKSKKFRKPMFILPILGRFEKTDEILSDFNYYLYCGHAGYFRAFKIIIDTMFKFKKKMILILYGPQNDKQIVYEYIKSKKAENYIEIKESISDKDLLKLYRKAIALLAPLDEKSLQDRARFSQKIAEYLMAQRPIITVDTGDIPYYFTHGKNAYILKTLSVEQLGGVLQQIEMDMDEANRIGLAGFEVGEKEFDYKEVSKKLCAFLTKK